MYDYQLILSVFHWFSPMDTREQFEEALGNNLRNARTTFAELPEAMEYTGKEGQHRWDKVNKWYSGKHNPHCYVNKTLRFLLGRTEEQVIRDVAKKFNFEINIQVLGALRHDTPTVRKMLRIDVPGNDGSIHDVKKVLNIYNCKKVTGGS